MSRRKISWSELPPELLSAIAARLQCRSDILNFRSICQTWRNSAPFSLLAGKTSILSPILPHCLSFGHFYDRIKHVNRHIHHSLVLVATSVILIRSIVNPSLPPWLFSVEECDSGKLYLRQFLSRFLYDELPTNFPEHLSLPCFRVSILCRFYTLGLVGDPYVEEDKDDVLMNRWTEDFKKVILYVDSDKCETESTTTAAPIRINDCALMVLFNGDADGSLAKYRFKDEKLSDISCQTVKKFDDVACFKGRVCVIDRKGRLYWEKNGELERPMAVSEPVGEGLGSDRRKRLVVEPCGELYLVYRCPRYMGVAFKIYKLNEGKKKWEELKGIGDDRIIVATQDGCFFVSTRDIPTWQGNCLVFSRRAFPAYSSFHGADNEIFEALEKPTDDIAVFHFGSGECRPISHGYEEVLWPVPTWLSSDAHSSKRLERDSQKDEELERGSQKDEELELDPLVRNCPESSGIKETSCTSGFQGHTQSKECVSSSDNQENLFAEGSTSNNTSHGNAITCIPKLLESGVSKTQFQGVDVSSELVPTLMEIWAKHGNILEGHSVHSNDLVAWALESIAKVVILLDSTSGWSLDNSQAEYLSSTLFDLQLMCLNVNWLVPSVAKALKLHKAMASKAEMEGTLKEIDKAATQVADMKSKLLAELGELETMLDEQRMKVRESLSVFDCLDGGNSLGK